MAVTLRDFMTTSDLLTVEASTTLGQAARLMRNRNVGAAVVLEDERVVGIFTERDLLRAIADSRHPDQGQVQSYMTPDPLTLPPDHPPSEAARIMSDRQFRHIPVVDGASWSASSRFATSWLRACRWSPTRLTSAAISPEAIALRSPTPDPFGGGAAARSDAF